MDENIRFIELLDTLKANGVISDYVQVSKELGTNKASISDIKSGRKKLSIDLLRRMKLSYPQTNIEWVMTGKGEMLNEEVRPEEEKEKIANTSPSTGIEDKLLTIIQEKDKVIREQVEEIGRLREQLAQLKARLQKSVAAANISGTAHVG